MKILIIIPTLPLSGGAQKVALDIAIELAKEKEVHFLCFDSQINKAKNIQGINFHFILETKHTFRYYFLRGRCKVKSIIKNISPDIIWVHKPSIIAYAAYSNKCKKILTFHNSEIHKYDYSFIKLWKFNFIAKFLVNKSDIVTTPSKHMQKYFSEYFDKNISYMPNGINTNIFKQSNIERDNYTILYVGRIIESKNVRFLFEMAEIMPEYNFIFIGEGKLKNSIKNHNISFLGEKNADELPFYYSKSTFCIFPSQFENCPLVGLEAMACGAIVIASATGFEEYIDNKIDGYIIKDLEPEKIKRLIYDLSSNIPQNESVREKAIKKASKYNWSSILTQYNDYFKS